MLAHCWSWEHGMNGFPNHALHHSSKWSPQGKLLRSWRTECANIVLSIIPMILAFHKQTAACTQKATPFQTGWSPLVFPSFSREFLHVVNDEGRDFLPLPATEARRWWEWIQSFHFLCVTSFVPSFPAYSGKIYLPHHPLYSDFCFGILFGNCGQKLRAKKYIFQKHHHSRMFE